MKYNKKLFKFLKTMYLIVIEFAVGLVLKYMAEHLFHQNEIISCLAFLIGIPIVALCYMLINDRILGKRISYQDSISRIQKVCQKFRTENEGKNKLLFELSEDNNIVHSQELYNQRGGMSEKHRNIVYYSLSAKSYLNWVDVVYFMFLREIKKELHCRVMVGIHLPDYIKECKLGKTRGVTDNQTVDPNTFMEEYKTISNIYMEYIKKIIGDDVKIIKETDLYKRNLNEYLTCFHDLYTSFVLYFAHKIGEKENEKTFTYGDFKRRISHLESAFPIWKLADRINKHDRIFILDSKYALQLWDTQPFLEIKRNRNIFLISGNDLLNGKKERIDVHKAENTINFTDSFIIRQEKIKKMDIETKKVMLHLLGREKYSNVVSADEGVIDIQLHEIITNIISEYKIEESEGKRDENRWNN